MIKKIISIGLCWLSPFYDYKKFMWKFDESQNIDEISKQVDDLEKTLKNDLKENNINIKCPGKFQPKTNWTIQTWLPISKCPDISNYVWNRIPSCPICEYIHKRCSPYPIWANISKNRYQIPIWANISKNLKSLVIPHPVNPVIPIIHHH